MKINEVVTEAGFLKSFGKGIARAIAPQTVQTYDRQKNALRTPTVDPNMDINIQARQKELQARQKQLTKYDKFLNIINSRANAGQKQSLQTIAQQLPKTGETANPDIRRQVLYYIAQQLHSRGIEVDGFSPPAPQEPIKIGDEIIQPSDPRYAEIMKTAK